ncbi:MAG: hypothetical protein HWN67_16525 [Candidatus Helarchaeota archaeon]|nr:hypothetical protein [Candidatus Helarchaeota archaeon]
MKKLTLLILLANFIYISGTRAQPIFNELWGNAGFTLALPKLYTLDLKEDQMDLMNISEGTFGLFLGFKANLFEIKKDFYFGPSVYYQYNMPGTQYIMFPEDFVEGYTQEIQYKISDFSINGDFYYKIPGRERDLYAGAGVGIHDVRFKTKFILEPWRSVPGLNDDDWENDEINESETKVGFHLIGKVKIIQNLFLEGRFEFVSGLNQFKLVWTYKLWSKRRDIPEE